MTFDIKVTLLKDEFGEKDFRLDAAVYDDAGDVIFEGTTNVAGLTDEYTTDETGNGVLSVAAEDKAREYGEKVFLVDMRSNFRQLKGLEFPWEVTKSTDPEVIIDEPTV